MIFESVTFIILQHQRLGDTFAHDKLYRKLHTHRDDHERAGQFVDHRSDEFWKAFCTLKARKTEEHRQNGAPMPIDKELMYEARVTAGALFPVAASEYQMEHIARRRFSNKLLTPTTSCTKQWLPLNVVGISMSGLGSLESPPDWQMPGYPSGEGTSYARPRGEGDDSSA
ncbi:hypothetical protein M9H77_22749 [Catharanthus roseus]|uniref:Uncharacterized protein n=1 Tax=Catharanthus roseus TaxID=4058 RepID=A0ACC0AS24_CATRO|nr:hypothetical protein M9H77_22749 [Catharanthus roseus]